MRAMMMRALLAGLCASALALGCASHHHDPQADDSLATLSIDPPMSELLITNNAPASENFTATLTYPDGSKRDVTAETHFAIDSSYGTFAQNTLSVTTAGKTVAYAALVDKTASAQIIVRLKNTRVDPSLPPNAVDWFSGPEDTSRASHVVYPPKDVVMPRNLGDFEIHWTDSNANDVFELSLKSEFADVRVYVPGANGVPAAGAGAGWSAFLADEWLAAVGHEPTVAYQVRGVQSSNPVSVGTAGAELVTLSNEPMLGGLYYWAATASSGAYGIFRHDMSKPGLPAEQYMTTVQTGNRCVACHVLSRDGTKMAVTYDGGNGAATLVDVATRTPQGGANAWNFGAFTPDGAQFLSVSNGTLVVRNYADQTVLATMPASGWVTHPDLSADGKSLVYVHPGTAPDSDWSFTAGQLFTRTYDAATQTFGPELQLVSDGNNNYYPSFSPDGKWILFNRAVVGGSYNNGDASLWVIKADGSAPAVELAKSNAALGLTNSWGRWAPFAQTIGQNGEQMYWVTVSSKRDFGVRLVGEGKPQIWMTPFFPSRAGAGQDPSIASFRLPFQNIDSNNHIAQWTEQVVATQ
jgi:hypothetical protein